MEAKPAATLDEKIVVSKRDVIEAWSLLERVVVSLRKIGSYYAIPQGQTEQTPEQRQEMLEALGQFFTTELWREMSHARRLLDQYIPNDEGEAISDSLEYWKPKSEK